MGKIKISIIAVLFIIFSSAQINVQAHDDYIFDEYIINGDDIAQSTDGTCIYKERILYLDGTMQNHFDIIISNTYEIMSSDEKILTVSDEGIVTPVGLGEANIYFYDATNQKIVLPFKVIDVYIEVSDYKEDIGIGESIIPTVVAYGVEEQDIRVQVSNKYIEVSKSSEGANTYLTGKKLGKSIVTYAAGNCKKEIEINVKYSKKPPKYTSDRIGEIILDKDTKNYYVFNINKLDWVNRGKKYTPKEGDVKFTTYTTYIGEYPISAETNAIYKNNKWDTSSSYSPDETYDVERRTKLFERARIGEVIFDKENNINYVWRIREGWVEGKYSHDLDVRYDKDNKTYYCYMKEAGEIYWIEIGKDKFIEPELDKFNVSKIGTVVYDKKTKSYFVFKRSIGWVNVGKKYSPSLFDIKYEKESGNFYEYALHSGWYELSKNSKVNPLKKTEEEIKKSKGDFYKYINNKYYKYNKNAKKWDYIPVIKMRDEQDTLEDGDYFYNDTIGSYLIYYKDKKYRWFSTRLSREDIYEAKAEQWSTHWIMDGFNLFIGG